MAQVESFRLDHTQVHAPYVRLGGRISGPHGDIVSKFDLRFAQPNQEFLAPNAIHTLEHLLAGTLRDHLDNVIDLSPMGCRTGFYLTVFGEPSSEQVMNALTQTLMTVRDQIDHIPGVSALECGNYRDHSLQSAKDWASKVLERGLKVQETVYLPEHIGGNAVNS
jgi:S-ribosylhomocysteine lyase